MATSVTCLTMPMNGEGFGEVEHKKTAYCSNGHRLKTHYGRRYSQLPGKYPQYSQNAGERKHFEHPMF